MSIQAEEQLERHFIRRLSRLNDVRRFVLGWLVLMCMLIGVVVVQIRALSPYYLELQPEPGGTYIEGMVGAFTNANPLFAVGTVDNSVSRLLSCGLLKYSSANKLVGDIAESWKIEDNGRKYVLRLKPDVRWHDGRPLTSADVTFTYKLIQNPDTRSPLFSSWRGVKVTAPDEQTVIFTLPTTLASFQYSLTNGLVPKHILETIAPEQLRSAMFNTVNPVGCGPFMWGTVGVEGDRPEEREERIGLVRYENYHHGAPKLERLTIRTFRSEERLLESFAKQEITAMVGVSSIPDTLQEEQSVHTYNIPLTGAVMAFLKTSHEILKDKQVRQALVQSVDVNQLIQGIDYPVIRVDSPLLQNHIGYRKDLRQLSFSAQKANKLLDKAGWHRSTNEAVRTKRGKPLKLRLYAQNSSEFAYVTQFLQAAWRSIGVDIEVVLPEDDEFQTTVALNHNYDIVVYGISLGLDPDVFAYWHSSQADPRSTSRLNLSEYMSDVADQALEGGRTRVERKLRAVKYRPFLQAWRNDAPALAFYQPRFLYVVRGGVFNFGPQSINAAADRFSNVEQWMIHQARLPKQ